MGHRVEFSLAWRRLDVEGHDDFFANQVVRLSGKFDAEVEAIDREFGLQGNVVIGNINGGWKGNRFGDAMKREVTSDPLTFALGFNSRRGER